MDVQFSLNGMIFEYDEEKNRQNIIKHGISFEIAARVFWIMIESKWTTMNTA